MEIEKIKEDLSANILKIDPIGKKLKFILDNKPIVIDGSGDINVIREVDEEADCTITMSVETYSKVKNKKIKPMIATLTGKIKVKGDVGLAQKLKDLM